LTDFKTNKIGGCNQDKKEFLKGVKEDLLQLPNNIGQVLKSI
jgi:hypothetical protein